MNIRKSLILAIIIAVGINPFLPSSEASGGDTSNKLISEASWNYDTYTVQRLSFKNVDGLYKRSGVIFISNKDEDCVDFCETVDVTVINDGEGVDIKYVNSSITNHLWHKAQDERFIYYTPSNNLNKLVSVNEYKPVNGFTEQLFEFDHADNQIKFITFATDSDRIYSSILEKDEQNLNTEISLSVHDYDSGYFREGITEKLSARWQEVVDAHGSLVLVKFQFEGGYKQLWLVDESSQVMKEIPDTWTEPNSDIIAPHFMSDGTVRYFRNFRVFTYKDGVDEKPQSIGGAYLNWFTDHENNLQIVGDKMAWVDSANVLYLSDITGTTNFGKILGSEFTLHKDGIYFQSFGQYKGYDFNSKSWSTYDYLVTDKYEDVLIGNDASGDIWYENLSTGILLKVGYGSNALFTDRDHALFVGKDSKIYQATFSSMVDVKASNANAYKLASEATVYLVNDNKIWTVPDEATYLTWFDTWDDVQEINNSTLNTYKTWYTESGYARFAPGTKLKVDGNARVYMVGTDNQLHWIVSETVASSIFGTGWSKNIIDVSPTYLWKYKMGSNIEQASDV